MYIIHGLTGLFVAYVSEVLGATGLRMLEASIKLDAFTDRQFDKALGK